MEEQLPSNIKRVWFWQAGIDLLIAIIAVVILVVFHYIWNWSWWIVIIVGIIGLIDAIVEFSLVPYRYQFWHYHIAPHNIEVTKGFFVRKTVAVPILRVQDVTLSAGPLLQMQKLQGVQVHTAAASHDIGFFDEATATKLKQQIMALAKEEDVYDS